MLVGPTVLEVLNQQGGVLGQGVDSMLGGCDPESVTLKVNNIDRTLGRKTLQNACFEPKSCAFPVFPCLIGQDALTQLNRPYDAMNPQDPQNKW